MKATQVIISVLVALMILSLSASTFAAVDSVDILIKALIDRKILTEDDASTIRAEIATLRQDEDAAKTSYNVTGKRPIKISGYVQERYTQSTQPGTNDYFEGKRVRLGLAGDATQNVDFNLLVDFAGSKNALTSATLATTPKTSLTTKSAAFGKPLLLDAAFGYKLSNARKLSIGQFKVPFGLESYTSDAALDTINRTQVTETLVPGRDNGSNGRDVGIQYSGTKSLSDDGSRQIDYYLGLFDGAGINVADDNGAKDLAGRVVWKPGIDGLSIGLAQYSGKATVAELDHNRTGTEAVYLHGPWTLKGEYIWAKDAAIKKNGWYGTVVRQLNDSAQVVARYDFLDPNTAKAGDATNTLTLGLNYFLNKDGYTRWQLNYEKHGEQGASIKNDLFLAQFQAGF